MARIYKATFMCHDGGGILYEPGLHYQTDVPVSGSEPDPDDVADEIWNTVGLNFQQATATAIVCDELVVTEQVLPPAIGVQGAHAVAAGGLLPIGDTKLPGAMSALLSWHTAVHSRSARGHTFMPNPFNSADLKANGLWSDTFLAQLQGFANACLTEGHIGQDPFDTTLIPVIYSRTRHVRGQDPHTFKVTGVSVRPNPHWLRSRTTAP
jgi:hypothetical protein